MGILGQIRHGVGLAGQPITAAFARARAHGPRPPRFAGAFASRDEALATLPWAQRLGYDQDGVADVSFDEMQQVEIWDYPVIHWLGRLLGPDRSVLDAGGHMGTKYIAFGSHLDLRDTDWTVYDLPAIVAAARRAQERGDVPRRIGFEDRLDRVRSCNVLLASGLLQYLDAAFGDLVRALPRRPATLVLNKVALREGPELVTLERIGPARVPYRIRNRQAFEAELAALGYSVLDRWTIPQLDHVIPTHPWLGRSQSCGFVMRDRNADRVLPGRCPGALGLVA